MDRGRSGGNGSEAYLHAVHGGPGADADRQALAGGKDSESHRI